MMKNGFWVFGYGSLLWQPGFTYADRQIARMQGYTRSFCMRSIHHRGSDAQPGLVLALDRHDAGHCDGLAFQIEARHADATLAYLRQRELVSSAYLEQIHPVALRSGGQVQAVTYVIDPDHIQYCGGLALEDQAAIIATAVGGRGPNTEYLYNTASHLCDLGIEDSDLSWLARRVRDLAVE